MKKFRIAVWILVFWVAVGFLALTLPKDNTDQNGQTPAITPVAGFNQGAHFTLTDHNGNSFHSDLNIADGEYALLFFGFTHCPAICPTELQKMAIIMDTLPPEASAKLTPLFITIDPERDTVDMMKTYVPQFHEGIIGLTGDTKSVHKVLNDWKVFFSKVNDPAYTEYTMDHSTYSYLIDDTMSIKGIYRLQNTADQMAAHIEKILN